MGGSARHLAMGFVTLVDNKLSLYSTFPGGNLCKEPTPQGFRWVVELEELEEEAHWAVSRETGPGPEGPAPVREAISLEGLETIPPG